MALGVERSRYGGIRRWVLTAGLMLLGLTACSVEPAVGGRRAGQDCDLRSITTYNPVEAPLAEVFVDTDEVAPWTCDEIRSVLTAVVGTDDYLWRGLGVDKNIIERRVAGVRRIVKNPTTMSTWNRSTGAMSLSSRLPDQIYIMAATAHELVHNDLGVWIVDVPGEGRRDYVELIEGATEMVGRRAVFAGGALLVWEPRITCRDGTRGSYTLWADDLEQNFGPELIREMARINDRSPGSSHDVGELAGRLGDRRQVLARMIQLLPPRCNY